MVNNSKLKWARFILFLATIYNLFWGAVISLYPQIILFDSAPSTFMLIVLKCVGMLVGVYGIAYYFASVNPQRYWPLILVGFIGKILGPIGAIYYVVLGDMKPGFLWVNVFNDFIWLYPFGWILYQVLTDRLTTFNSPRENKSLYQTFLGDDFGSLSPNLREFHQSKTMIRAFGEFKVTRGGNFITNMFANVADLPLSANAAEAELIVRPSPNQETWTRRIGDKKVISEQWLENEFLVERFKGIKIYLSAQVVEGNLIIYDVVSTVLGFPMPPFFTPTVLATGADEDDGVLVNVEIGFKPFGRIINYCGIVKTSKVL